MKIIAISDIHGSLPNIRGLGIPDEGQWDLLVMPGDIAGHDINNFELTYHGRKIDKEAEAIYQKAWAEKELTPWLDNFPAKKKIGLSGNHEFGDISKPFDDFLVTGSKTIEVDGFKIGMLVGVPPYVGEWQDEIEEYEMKQRILNIDPDIDILLSHVPPLNMLDLTLNGQHIGSSELYYAIFGISGVEPYFNKLKLNVFGHVHEAGDKTHTLDIDGRDISFYNVSQNFKSIKLEK